MAYVALSGKSQQMVVMDEQEQKPYDTIGLDSITLARIVNEWHIQHMDNKPFVVIDGKAREAI